MKIWIYSDDGVANIDLVYSGVMETLRNCSLQNEYHVELIMADDILKLNESPVKVLIIPGGRASPYVKKLAGKGCHYINSYVQKGGSYLGLGAGAYFASSAVEFEKGTTLEICRNNELEFFPGIARGTVYPGFQYNNNRGSTAANLVLGDLLANQLSSTFCRLYYNGGCEFVPKSLSDSDLPQIEVLAKYKEKVSDGHNPWDGAAIIKCNVGKGIAVLSGVHPEFPFSLLDKSKYDPKLLTFLYEYDSARKSIMSLLINILLQDS
ncbi:Biotin--protein ligase [Trichoplax sp. H2]|nr:Biotin--protein ligase [Trichoplax sp. H2]|eukprot:RDD42436.1 Biotin--protein ligase [Trichoplax sp. H2]